MDPIEDLAASYRILAAQGVLDAYGHVSIRSPSDPGRYFMARAMPPEMVTTKDIVEFDLDSRPVTPVSVPLYKERYIHGELYKARPDVNAVVHNHSPSVIPFGVTEQPMRGLTNTGSFIGLGVPVFEIRDFQESCDIMVRNPQLGEALAGVVGGKPAALMRGHGSVVVGASLQIAVGRCVYLELSAKLQMQAMTIAGPGGKVTYLDDAEVNAMVVRQDYERPWKLWRTKAIAELRAEAARGGPLLIEE